MTTDEFRVAMIALPAIIPNGNLWDRHRKAIRNHVVKDDPEEFLKWSTISATMHVGMSQARVKEYNHLISYKNNKDFLPNEVLFAVTDTGFGAPEFYNPNAKFPLPKYGANYIHQAFKLLHLQTYLHSLDIKLSDLKSVAEFGGGYGAMAVIMHRYGFRGQYHLYDFPELLLLQQYYLSNMQLGIKAHFLESIRKKKVDLAIGVMSLSECPLETRIKFLEKIEAKYYFIQFQEAFFGIDNYTFFRDWAKENLSDWEITRGKMRTHHYLVGER